MARTRVVTYDGLPATAGGAHSLRVKRPHEAFRRVRDFVAACAEPPSSPAWAFQVAAGGPEEATARLVALATERFGGPRHRARTHTEWHVRPDSAPGALDVLAEAGTDAVTSYGHSLAALTYRTPVRLVDPATGVPYPDITPDAFGGFAVDGYGRLLGESGVRATFGTAGSSLSLWLNLPADERLPAGVRHLADNLPFRLSAKHWRLWSPTRGGSYRSARTPLPGQG
ncbi:hypothetical protein [Saccharothrix obliqua]|uniref:hypothetical protein n=1 Tax=Saccharothrix obliqua TaxID=2861747 RepID=UPI001C5EE60C|nr:hypothetical protein [Saccharothrix obliqua]MBW4716887.1 hypothetical protein [Saccharothrix obliqua]